MATSKIKYSALNVISTYLEVKSQDDIYSCHCPFCETEKDSQTLLISKDKTIFQCYDCGASGDAVSFLMQYKGVSLSQAQREVEQIEGLRPRSLYRAFPNEKELARKIKDTLAINKEATKFYYKNLKSKDPTGLEYLHSRGLTDKTITKFAIGYANNDFNALYRHLKNVGFSEAQIQTSGLVMFNGEKRIDSFRDRVVCPIVDENKNVLGFSGRAIKDDMGPKYKNSPVTVVFDKRSTLYGINFAAQTKSDKVIICEGNMDIISLNQAGYDNAVATLGTAFTEEHANHLKMYTNRICLMFDSDEAGVNAALRTLPTLLKTGFEVEVADLQPFKDPNEFLNAKDKSELSSRIENAEDGIMFMIRHKYPNLSDPSQKHNVYKQFANDILYLPRDIQDRFIDKFKEYESQVIDFGRIEANEPAETKTLEQEDIINNKEDGSKTEDDYSRVDTSFIHEYSLDDVSL